jgi:hypothetical protein
LLDRGRCCDEDLVRPGQPDAVGRAVAAHHGDDARSFDLFGPHRSRLRGGHRQVQEEEMVGGQKLRQRDPAVIWQTRDLWQQVAGQQAGGALGPHVYVVADLYPLGGKSEEVDRAR